jgi:hypothetical protein
MAPVFCIWSMTPIELAHVAEGWVDRNRQAGKFNIFTQEKKRYRTNVSDELFQLTYFGVLTHIYVQNIDISASIYLLPSR